MEPLHVLILAAGEGTRMRSRVPKVLHPLLGLPMVAHVVRAAADLEAASVTVVVSADADALRAALSDHGVGFAVQDPPRGTGDAVSRGLAAAPEAPGRVLVVNGDCPGVRTETLRGLLEADPGAAGTFLTVSLDDPTGYGRIVRDERGDLERIAEESDADAEQRRICEVNAGLYAFDLEPLRAALDSLQPDNAQGEYYLTDTLGALREAGHRVAVHHHDDAAEVHGVNTRAELARAEDHIRRRKLDALMEAGVTLRLPETIRVDVDVEVGRDTVLYPGVVLEAGTSVGCDCVLYPQVRVARSTLGDGVTVLDGSIVEDAVVEDRASLGPYARLRPGAHVCQEAKIGNFVEVKASRVGRGSKASHLTYLGNAEIGEGVNVGAGTITCNYDGVAKHTTTIEDGAFIGSNTALVAPVRIGAGAYVGAGSTITEDVPAGGLGVGRGRQANREGWAERFSPTARARRRRAEDDAPDGSD